MAQIVAPTALVGARSPIYITIGEAAETVDAPYDAQIQVFIWDGGINSRPSSATYILLRDKFPTFTSGDTYQVTFDIAPLVREQLGGVFDTSITRSAPVGERNTNVVWVDIDYSLGYYSIASPTVVTQASGSSGTFPVSDGYHEYEQ